MKNPELLTRAEVIQTASTMRWNRKMPKWTVTVEGRELPARPLIRVAADVRPNHPTNSHQSIKILERLGFVTHYQE